MKANTLLNTIIVFVVFLIITGVIFLPFFVLFKKGIKDYMPFFMLFSAIIMLVYYVRIHGAAINLTAKPDKVSFISLFFIILFLSVYLLFISLYKESFVPFIIENSWFLMSAIIIGPLAEEIVFRQLLFNQLAKVKGFWIAALFTSTIFALIHINLIQILSAFVISVILSYNFYKKESLMEVYLLHGLSNFIALIVPHYLLS